ncbi:hypothetical protein Patl1_07331 [Pistacia atlantica]|uniref:Uncharacterized protein n=1 Tax=Pistacia atlantica TaxID=434234 RepID=A0ACC1AKZ3_9ROSI|nr:hypothetical protein Patl1_07331 [Pistacia atlantica]
MSGRLKIKIFSNLFVFVVLQNDTALSKGRRLGTGTLLSLYLALADLTTLAPGSKIYAPGSSAGQAHGW